MPESNPDRRTIQQAAEQLHLSPDGVLKRIRRGKLHAVKEAGQWRIPWPPQTEPDRQDTPQTRKRTDTEQSQAQEIALLNAQIARLEERIHQLEERLHQVEEDRDLWRSQAQHALKALDQQQQLALPDRMKDVPKALPEDTRKRRWWEVWKR